MSVVDVDRIFEISVNKIEHSNTRKVYGKSTMLHRKLLVNTVINRVRNSDRMYTQKNVSSTSFTNYREPRTTYDIDEYECDKSLTYMECQARCKTKHYSTTQKKKISSLVTLLNSRSLNGKNDSFRKLGNIDDEKENMLSKDSSKIEHVDTTETILREKRRLVVTDSEEITHTPKKKLRSIWPTNVTDVNYSMTGLASLFGDLVASCDNEKSNISLTSSNFAAMVAC